MASLVRTLLGGSRKPPASRVKHRGIVVVHGVGSQSKGEQLDIVVQPLVEFLARSLGHRRVAVVFKEPPGDEPIGQTEIHLRDDAGELDEVWHVREAWWAQSFRPSSSAVVLTWALRALAAHTYGTWTCVFAKSLGRVFGTKPTERGIWTTATAGPAWCVLNLINWFLITALYTLADLLGFFVAVALLFFSKLLIVGFIFPGFFEDAVKNLIDFLTGGIGDQQAMTNRSVSIAEASSTVVAALEPFFDARSARTPKWRKRADQGYATVTVLAHSCGCVVSYDALAGETVRGWVGVDPATGEGSASKRITWATLGSGLNLAWRMQAPRHDGDHVFWRRRLDSYVNWLDVYARYDGVPQGAAPSAMVEAIAGPAVLFASGSRRPYVTLRVVNDDWPMTEHGSYWENYEEVAPRLVHAISDDRFGSRSITDTLLWEGVDMPDYPLRAAVQRKLKDGPKHRRMVAASAFLKLALVVAGAVFLFGAVHVLGILLLCGGVLPALFVLAHTAVARERMNAPQWLLLLALLGGSAGAEAYVVWPLFWRPPFWVTLWQAIGASAPILWIGQHIPGQLIPQSVIDWLLGVAGVGLAANAQPSPRAVVGLIAVALVAVAAVAAGQILGSLWDWARRERDDFGAAPGS